MYNRTGSVANYPALGNNVIWIRFAEPSTLEKVHDVCFAGALLVKTVLVLFQTDRSPNDNLVAPGGKPVVRVVEHNLDCRPCE